MGEGDWRYLQMQKNANTDATGSAPKVSLARKRNLLQPTLCWLHNFVMHASSICVIKSCFFVVFKESPLLQWLHPPTERTQCCAPRATFVRTNKLRNISRKTHAFMFFGKIYSMTETLHDATKRTYSYASRKCELWTNMVCRWLPDWCTE